MSGGDSHRALAVLAKFHDKLKSDGLEDHAHSLSKVQNMLQSPVFGHLMNIQSSMQELGQKIKDGLSDFNFSSDGSLVTPRYNGLQGPSFNDNITNGSEHRRSHASNQYEDIQSTNSTVQADGDGKATNDERTSRMRGSHVDDNELRASQLSDTAVPASEPSAMAAPASQASDMVATTKSQSDMIESSVPYDYPTGGIQHAYQPELDHDQQQLADEHRYESENDINQSEFADANNQGADTSYNNQQEYYHGVNENNDNYYNSEYPEAQAGYYVDSHSNIPNAELQDHRDTIDGDVEDWHHSANSRGEVDKLPSKYEETAEATLLADQSIEPANEAPFLRDYGSNNDHVQPSSEMPYYENSNEGADHAHYPEAGELHDYYQHNDVDIDHIPQVSQHQGENYAEDAYYGYEEGNDDSRFLSKDQVPQYQLNADGTYDGTYIDNGETAAYNAGSSYEEQDANYYSHSHQTAEQPYSNDFDSATNETSVNTAATLGIIATEEAINAKDNKPINKPELHASDGSTIERNYSSGPESIVYDPVFHQTMQAAAQGRMIKLITLHKPESGGLGFSVVGLNSESHGELGIFVQEIRPNGVAAMDGRLQESDQILAINNVRIDSNVPHHDAIKLLQQAAGRVELVIARGDNTDSPGVSRSSSMDDATENGMRKRTMSTASAASELSAIIQTKGGAQWRQIELVSLYNDGSGLGFGIIGGRTAGVLIKTILAERTADCDGRLQSGDQLLQIDDVVLKGMSSEQVAGVLRQCSNEVNLIVARKTSFLPPSATCIYCSMPPKTYDIKISNGAQSGLDIQVGGYVGEQINEDLLGLFVIGATRGSLNAVCKQLQENDQILKVNGESVLGKSALEVCEILRSSGEEPLLTLAHTSLSVTNDSTLVEANSQSQLLVAEANEELVDHDKKIAEAALNSLKNNGQIDENSLEAIKLFWQEKIGSDQNVIVAQFNRFNSKEGLGIKIEAKVKETGAPQHVIRSIAPNGLVDSAGMLLVGDELLEINGNRFSGLSDKDVVGTIRQLPPYVYIITARKLVPIEEVVDSQALKDVHSEAPLDFSFMSEEDANLTPSEQMHKSPSTISDDDISVKHHDFVRKVSLDQFAATAKWSDVPIIVKLTKGDRGLGFSLLDYYSDNLNEDIILIRNVVKGGVADTDGSIQPGDRLLSVNGTSLQGMTLDDAAEMLKSAPPGLVEIGIIKPVIAPSTAKNLIMESVPESASENLENDAATAVTVGAAVVLEDVRTTSSRGSYRDKRPPPLQLGQSEAVAIDSETDLPSYVEKITIDKGKAGLGLNIMSDDHGYGAAIKNILIGGAVEKDGRLQVGDIIMAINDKSVVGLSSIKARALLRRYTLHGDQITFNILKKNLVGKVPIPESADSSPGKKFSVKKKSRNAEMDVADAAAVVGVAAAAEAVSNESKQQSQIQEDVIVPHAAPSDKEAAVGYSISKLQMQHETTDNVVEATVAASVAADTVAVVADVAESKFISDNERQNAQEEYASTGLLPPTKVVELYRDPQYGLGIGIATGSNQGGTDSSESVKGVFVRQIKEESPAGRCGQLKPGDRLLQVNGVDVSNATQAEVAKAIRNSPDPIRIVVQSLRASADAPSSPIKAKSAEVAQSADQLTINNVEPMNDAELVAATVPSVMLQNNNGQRVYGDGAHEDNADLNSDDESLKFAVKYDVENENVFVVNLFKGNRGLGISVAEKRLQDFSQIFVADVKSDGIAGLDGRIRRGDELLEVNDFRLRGLPQKEALSILKKLTEHVKLIVYRTAFSTERPSSSIGLIPERPEATTEASLKTPESQESPAVSSTSPAPIPLEPTSPKSTQESVLIVTLIKDRVKGLGLAVGEPRGSEKDTGHYMIKSIAEGGVAARDGRLKVGDRLLAVNGKYLTNMSYREAIEVLKDAEGAVTLTASTTAGTGLPASPFSTLPRNFDGILRPSDHDDSQKESAGTTPTNASPAETPVVKAAPSNFDQETSLRTCPIIAGKETSIEIDKGDGGLGISIIGGANTLLGATVIYKIYEGGATHLDGRLQVGDHILEVNGINLRKADHDAAITALRISPPVVKFVIFRENADNLPVREDIFDVFSIELRRNSSEGFGFSITGSGAENGVFISDIVADGLAEKDGRLLEGDQIMAINGIDLRKAPQQEAAAVLKRAEGKVKLTVGRLKAGSVTGSVMSAWPSTSSLIGGGLQSSTDSLLNVATSQKTENKAKIVQIFKQNPSDALGLSLSGGAGSALGDVPISVVLVRPGGLAAKNGEIKVNDQILKINSQSLDGLTDIDAAKMLKKATGVITLQILSPETDKSKIRISSSTSPDLSPPTLVKNPLLQKEIGGTSTPKEPAKQREIVLERVSGGLGFSIVGGSDSPQGSLPICVKQVFPWGAASKTQDLKQGDQLIAANGQSLVNVTHEEAVNVLKSTKGKLVLTVVS